MAFNDDRELIKRIAIVVLVLAILIVLNPVVMIGAGERGVVLNFGAVQPLVLGEGLHFRMPLVQSVVKMDVRVQKEVADAAAASKDLQDTRSTVALNYHPQPDRVNEIFQKIGNGYGERVIDPAIQEVVKAVTARYTAVELITLREQVRKEIRDMLRERLLPYAIVVDDLAIVNFSFSQQFSQAIEAKQTAEQMALKAQRDLERIKVEAEQKVAQAQAEAEALRLQKQEVTPELVRLREIEVNSKAIDKWDGHLPTVTGGAMPLVNLPSK